MKRDSKGREGSMKRLLILFLSVSFLAGCSSGFKYQRKADPAQRKTLIDEFRTLLVHTYSGALAEYKNEAIEVLPLRAAPTDTDVDVRTQVKRPGTQPIGIDYSMEKTADGWKVYDVVIAGVSLVTNYRDTFNAQVRDGGVDGLIKTLAEKNRTLEIRNSAKSK